MIRHITAAQRHYSEHGWLKTHWLFSFADYYDPTNIQFGALRVFNDDIVDAHSGFPTHPHREMEIVTLVLDGEITHQDSTGNKQVMKPGMVQRMSAGTGIQHSEMNLSDKPVHFYQIWIEPDERGIAPGYASTTFDPESWHNTLLPIASGEGKEGAVPFHTAASIYRTQLDAGKSVEHKQCALRRVFIYTSDGELNVNGVVLQANDQARIDEEETITITANKDTHFVLIDVPSCKGFGYSEETLAGEQE